MTDAFVCDAVRPIVSFRPVALTVRLPDLKRSEPLSVSVADEPTVAWLTVSFPLENVTFDGFNARLPAAESSRVAGAGAWAAAVLGAAAINATATAITGRVSDIGPIPTLADGNGP